MSVLAADFQVKHCSISKKFVNFVSNAFDGSFTKDWYSVDCF